MKKKGWRPPEPVAVNGLDDAGIAVGTDTKGRQWTLRGAIPGSDVLAVGRRHAGSVTEVTRPHPDAVPAACPQFGVCGGCLYQTLPLDRQREEKLRALNVLLAPLGAGTGTMRGEAGGYGYRNRVELSFGVDRYLSNAEIRSGAELTTGGRYLGFHGPGRFDRIVDAESCSIAAPAMQDVLARVRRDTLASPFAPRSPRTNEGFWRHLGLREGTNGVIVLVYTSLPGAEEEAWLRAHAPTWGAAAVLWYATDRTSDAAVGELREVLCGEAVLQVSLGGVPLRLSPLAFFQVNPTGAEVLLDVIRDDLGEGGLLLDLYCGVGALGLALHARFEAVAGIDVVEEGIVEAMRNASELGVRADYRAGRAELVLPQLLTDHGLTSGKREGGRLAVLVDPPRAGLHPNALTPLLSLEADVLVYVACRPTSLARDGAALLAAGWRCTGWTAVDLFPHTAHVEVVARFVRAKDAALR